MTNDQHLSHLTYTATLTKTRMNHFYISIHDHKKKLHKNLTHTPDSFEQTVEKLRSIAKLKRFRIELHTSTIITKRNLPNILDIYRFLRRLNIDQIVFNVIQTNNHTKTNFEHIFPKYSNIASTFRKFLHDIKKPQPITFLVDIPLYTTKNVADFNHNYVKRYVHYDMESYTIINPSPKKTPKNIPSNTFSNKGPTTTYDSIS